MLIGRVEDTYWSKGRGLIVTVNTSCAPSPEGVKVKIGDPLEFRYGDGVRFIAHIAGIEMGYIPPPERLPGILLRELTEDDVPIGAEVWTLQ